MPLQQFSFIKVPHKGVKDHILAENDGHSPRFSAKQIKEALKRLEPTLGHSAVDALIYELGNFGLPLVNDHAYFSIEQIQAALEKIFGEEAASLIFRRLTKEL